MQLVTVVIRRETGAQEVMLFVISSHTWTESHMRR